MPQTMTVLPIFQIFGATTEARVEKMLLQDPEMGKCSAWEPFKTRLPMHHPNMTLSLDGSLSKTKHVQTKLRPRVGGSRCVLGLCRRGFPGYRVHSAVQGSNLICRMDHARGILQGIYRKVAQITCFLVAATCCAELLKATPGLIRHA